MTRAGGPTRGTVHLGSKPAEGSGLMLDSVIMADNLATIRDSEIDRVIGVLDLMSTLDAALRATLAL